MKRLTTTLVLVVSMLCHHLPAQSLSLAAAAVDSVKSENSFQLKSISTSISPTPKDVFLTENWQHGVLVMDNDRTLFFNGRINVTRGYLECKVDNFIRKIASGRVKLIDLEGSKYVPVSGSTIQGGGINTFMKVLSLGEVNLLQGYRIEVKSRGGDSLNPKSPALTPMKLDLNYITPPILSPSTDYGQTKNPF